MDNEESTRSSDGRKGPGASNESSTREGVHDRLSLRAKMLVAMGVAFALFLLDPANKAAFKNLEAAGTAFRDAQKQAPDLARDDPATFKALKVISTSRRLLIGSVALGGI
jgi:hypothetical protein